MRFVMDADDRAAAWRYLEERAYQAAIDGWRQVSRQPEPLIEGGREWGVRGVAQKAGREAQSIYVYASARGGGRLARYLAGSEMPVITTPDCQIEAFLRHVEARFEVVAAITDTREYKAIEDLYGDQAGLRESVALGCHEVRLAP